MELLIGQSLIPISSQPWLTSESNPVAIIFLLSLPQPLPMAPFPRWPRLQNSPASSPGSSRPRCVAPVRLRNQEGLGIHSGGFNDTTTKTSLRKFQGPTCLLRMLKNPVCHYHNHHHNHYHNLSQSPLSQPSQYIIFSDLPY